MFVLFIVCLIKLYEMYMNNNKMARNRCARNSKENYIGLDSNTHKIHQQQQRIEMFDNILNNDRYRDQLDQQYDINHNYARLIQQKTGINSHCGMNDYSTTNNPAFIKQKLIKTGLLSSHQPSSPQHRQSSVRPKPPLLKQPLSSINSNYVLNSRNISNINNNNYDFHHHQQQINRGRTLSSAGQRLSGDLDLNSESLSSEALKKNVQIVLKNLQDALINSQDSLNQSSTFKDRLQFLNIFSSSDDRSIENQRVQNLRNSRKMSTSPADCDNTNNNMGPPSLLGCSFASDFTHDNSDYQWFVDYGYRDGVQHQSILSSLSASYSGIGELSYYEDMAKNIDANLAEVDMENFRSEDIHSLLKLQQQQQNSIIRSKRLHLKDQNEFDNSICKSEILFSPVKESHISVDSLDMDGYQDDIILTCQANKNNYTIAFEGSCMYSDESYYDIPENGRLKQNSLNLDNILNNQANDADMTQSAGFTTWSQLKKSNECMQMQRYPSGNNNNTMTSGTYHHINCSSVRKSSSMPNLKAILQAQQQQLQRYQLNVSEVASTSNESSMEEHVIEGEKPKVMLPMFQMPITSSETNSHNHNDNSTSNNERIANPPSFNLVKLFIKQKSSSSDTCMDVSSGCWPSDSTNSSTEHPGNANNGSNSSLNRLRKKSMNDSGKCSALSKHEEDAEYQLDSLDAHVNDRKTNDFNREIFDSPTHRRNYKDCALNIRKNQLLMNVLSSSRQSQSDASRTSENLTQIFKQDEAAKVTVPIDMITKSIQTSLLLPSQNEKSFTPYNNIKMVPPSFLTQLSKLGSEKQAPVYVIYPNYALPDLGFINKQSLRLQKDVIMSPLEYQGQPKMAQTLNHQRRANQPMKRRPLSLDVERHQQKQYEHVQDWKSLLTLLPRDYRKLLKNVPEVGRISTMDASIGSQKPMFCMTPSIRKTSMMCDCQTLLNQTTNSSSSGGSSQQPSSGFRGSSTMLSDSEMDVLIYGGSTGDHVRKLFGGFHEEASNEPRPPTGRKGILRRTNTTTNTPARVTPVNQPKTKRYSMMDQPKSPIQQSKPLTVVEKRRSLPEPNYYDNNGLEEYFNNIGGTKNFANRLPNYMKTRDGEGTEKDINQLMTELELNKALSNKLNYDQKSDDIIDIEAKLRVESLLNGIPKSEWKHYAEIVSLLEMDERIGDVSDLRDGKTLASRKVSFNHPSPQRAANKNTSLQAPKFTTPPNSPQMSQFVNNSSECKQELEKKQARLEKEKQEKIQTNRFKRLQIQWELLSKDQEEQRAIMETKSGGTTPTGHNKVLSKIPRPVSYPNSRTPEQHQIQIGKPLRSPSRMHTPKKYTTTPTNQTITSPTTGIPRTPNKLHTTPKKTLPVRQATRTR